MGAIAAATAAETAAADVRRRVTAAADILLPAVVAIQRPATAAADPRTAVDRRTVAVATDTADNRPGRTGLGSWNMERRARPRPSFFWLWHFTLSTVDRSLNLQAERALQQAR